MTEPTAIAVLTDTVYRVHFGPRLRHCMAHYDVLWEDLNLFGYSEDSAGAEQFIRDTINGAPLPPLSAEIRGQEQDEPGLCAMLIAHEERRRADIVALWKAHA